MLSPRRSVTHNICLHFYFLVSRPGIGAVRPFTESEDTRGCNNIICPPEDEQGTA